MRSSGHGAADHGEVASGNSGNRAFLNLPAAAGAARARDAFTAFAAHQLRNPMTPMVCQVDPPLHGLRAGTLPPNRSSNGSSASST